MSWELSRRRIVRTVNEKFIFGRIVRLPVLFARNIKSPILPSTPSDRCWSG